MTNGCSVTLLPARSPVGRREKFCDQNLSSKLAALIDSFQKMKMPARSKGERRVWSLARETWSWLKDARLLWPTSRGADRTRARTWALTVGNVGGGAPRRRRYSDQAPKCRNRHHKSCWV